MAAEATARAAVLQRLLDCRKVEGGAARLACYDAAAGVLLMSLGSTSMLKNTRPG